jgi:hypothetical protein
MLFKWMAERDSIRRKKQAGIPAPWSEDPIFQEREFRNVYRLCDEGTQYILREVINRGDQSHWEICFRVMLYRLFNRIGTWELIQMTFGPVSSADFDMNECGRVLLAAMEKGHPIYTSAHRLPAPNLGEETTVMNHLKLLQRMMKEDFPNELLKRQTMRDAFNLVSHYPGMGPFLSFQLSPFRGSIPLKKL